MFMRTGLTIDEFDSKPESVQEFLMASITFQIEKEIEEHEEIKREAKRKRAANRR